MNTETASFSTRVTNKEYESKLPYPTRPDKPFIKKDASPKDYRDFATILEGYEAKKLVFEAEKKAYQEDNARLKQQFKIDLLAELGISNHPKRESLYSLAWDYGHATGLYEVYIHAEKLVDLL